MIQQVRKKFTRSALLALSAAMILVTAAINAANWISVRLELGNILNTAFLMEEAVYMEDWERKERNEQEEMWRDITGRKSPHMQGLISEARFFAVFAGEDGGMRIMERSREQSISEEEMLRLAGEAYGKGRETGFLGSYLYKAQSLPEGGTRLVFLNCATKLAGVRFLLIFSAVSCLICIFLAWLFVRRAAVSAVRPIAETMERQKRFITDASHELKTPLAVISANMDVLEMDLPDNRWVKSTKKQTAQTQRLVEEMVYLSRLEENGTAFEFQQLDLKKLIEDTAEPFVLMAEFQGKELQTVVPDHLEIEGEKSSLERLISILCDNAVKYAPGGDRIRLEAKEDGKYILIQTENAMEHPISQEECAHLFDRFYRADPSRSKQEKSGFGIGLAIASAVCEKHGGQAQANLIPEGRLFLSCRLPAKHPKS